MSKAADKLSAFIANNPNAPTTAEVHPERLAAFNELRRYCDEIGLEE